MDLNLLLSLKMPLSLTETENKPTLLCGTLSTPPSDTKMTVNFQKWTTTNFVSEFKTVTFALLMYIAVGVKLLKDACPETKNTLFAPLLALMDGFSKLNLAKEKFHQECSLMLPLKLQVSLLPKKLEEKPT